MGQLFTLIGLVPLLCMLLLPRNCLGSRNPPENSGGDEHPHHPHICESEADCGGNFMTCLDNRCVCDEDEEARVEPLVGNRTEGDSYYTHACRGVALVGDHCDNVTHICTENSYCDPISRSCLCNPGFEEYSFARECKRKYGENCNDARGESCNPEKFLSCEDEVNGNGRCGCDSGGGDLKWDSLLARCVARVGGQCELKTWAGIRLGCGEGVQCAKEKGSGGRSEYHYGVCKCLHGYYEEGGFRCIPIWGKVCNNEESDCGDGYVCSGGRCECGSGLVWDYETSKGTIRPGCRVGVGQPCTIQGEGGIKRKDNCVNNAMCLDNETGSGLRCECLEDFISTGNKTCQLGLGAKNCSKSGLSCHVESGLVCSVVNDICTCPLDHDYDLDKGLCLGGHGARCAAEDSRCIYHAQCHKGYCECDEGFIVGEEGSCYHGYGTACVPGDCLSELGMECGANGTCICQPNSGTIYDKDDGSCLLKVGQPCNYGRGEGAMNNMRRCVTTAFCGTGDLCQCYSGYLPTQRGHCEKGWGLYCGVDDLVKCNRMVGLECVEGNDKCDCCSGKVWNAEEEVCQNKSGVDVGVVVEEKSSTIEIFIAGGMNSSGSLTTTLRSTSPVLGSMNMYWVGGVVTGLIVVVGAVCMGFWFMRRRREMRWINTKGGVEGLMLDNNNRK